MYDSWKTLVNSSARAKPGIKVGLRNHKDQDSDHSLIPLTISVDESFYVHFTQIKQVIYKCVLNIFGKASSDHFLQYLNLSEFEVLQSIYKSVLTVIFQ